MTNSQQLIELSLSRNIQEVLQLDCDEVRNMYSLSPSRPSAKRDYYVAPLDGWRKLVADLFERASGGWDPDCTVSRSTATRLQARLDKAVRS